jgi:hypothetical protein
MPGTVVSTEDLLPTKVKHSLRDSDCEQEKYCPTQKLVCFRMIALSVVYAALPAA